MHLLLNISAFTKPPQKTQLCLCFSCTYHPTEERRKLLWFSNEAAVEALIETGKCIPVSDVITEIDNLPGDAIHANMESIKEHFDDTAWAQVLAKGILSYRENAYISSPA